MDNTRGAFSRWDAPVLSCMLSSKNLCWRASSTVMRESGCRSRSLRTMSYVRLRFFWEPRKYHTLLKLSEERNRLSKSHIGSSSVVQSQPCYQFFACVCVCVFVCECLWMFVCVCVVRLCWTMSFCLRCAKNRENEWDLVCVHGWCAACSPSPIIYMCLHSHFHAFLSLSRDTESISVLQVQDLLLAFSKKVLVSISTLPAQS